MAYIFFLYVYHYYCLSFLSSQTPQPVEVGGWHPRLWVCWGFFQGFFSLCSRLLLAQAGRFDAAWRFEAICLVPSRLQHCSQFRNKSTLTATSWDPVYFYWNNWRKPSGRKRRVSAKLWRNASSATLHIIFCRSRVAPVDLSMDYN